MLMFFSCFNLLHCILLNPHASINHTINITVLYSFQLNNHLVYLIFVRETFSLDTRNTIGNFIPKFFDGGWCYSKISSSSTPLIEMGFMDPPARRRFVARKSSCLRTHIHCLYKEICQHLPLMPRQKVYNCQAQEIITKIEVASRPRPSWD